MADDPKTFQLPDPAEQPDENQDSMLGLPPGDSTGQEPVEESKPGYGMQPLAADMISEIRQSLTTEEEQARKTSPTGNLIRRITGSLKRVTGPLGRTGPLGKTGPLPTDSEKASTLPSSAPTDIPPIEEMPDTLVSGRLEGTTISEQPAMMEETSAFDFYQPTPFEEETPQLAGDETTSLPDSGEIAASEKAEEETLAPETRSDWMAEIRGETAAPEGQSEEAGLEAETPPPPPVEKSRGFTAPLRSFITGVLGGEGRRKPPEEEMPDDLLAGRLSRSLTTGPLPQRKLPNISQPADQETLPENADEPRKTGVTGSLIRRVTGSLRRVTGPLGDTGPLAPQPGEEPTVSPVSPMQTARLEMPEDDDVLLGHQEEATAGEPQVLFEEPLEETPQLSGDEAISLLDSGAIAALGKAEEETRITENPPEWMAELRTEAAEPEEQPGEEPEEAGSETPPPPHAEKPRGFTAPLRSFITGVLGGESHRKPPEEEMPDDLLAGRLNRSLTTGPLPHREPHITAQPTGEETPAEKAEQTGTGALRAILGDVPEGPLVEDKPSVRAPLEQRAEDRPPTGSLKKSFFADLDDEELETGQLHPDKLDQISPAPGTPDQVLPEDRFAIFDQDQPKKSTGGLIIDEPLDLTNEEEQMLWGHVETPTPGEVIKPGPAKEPPMFTEEEIWGKPGEIEQPPEPTRSWNEPVEIEPVDSTTFYEPVTDDDYAQSFLTGSLVERHEEAPPVNLMQQALERHTADEIDPHNLRAIAMEGIEYEAPIASAYPRLYDEEEEEGAESAPFSFKTWFARRSAIEKFLLVEGMVAVLAMLIAIPFFIFIIAGGRPPSAAVVQPPPLSARPLPPGLPYPVEMTLPGGWSFPLQKSTFVKGEWKPATAEWLEGTELRRVVALPWNRQTEAVIQTFKTGDKIQVYLSNKDRLYFQVESIDRMPARDSSIFSDLSPSLVIVLFKEDSDERWVVQCQPSR